MKSFIKKKKNTFDKKPGFLCKKTSPVGKMGIYPSTYPGQPCT